MAPEQHETPESAAELEAKRLGIKRALAMGQLDNDALGELLDVARDQARAEVEVRGALNSRAGWLLGFAGVILTLAGAQAQKVLNEASTLGDVDRPLAIAFLGLAVLAVGIAAYCALEVLRLRPAVFISDDELLGLSASPLRKGPQAFVRGRMLNNVAEEVVENRRGNDTRRDWLRRATAALVVAALALVLHVGVFLERAAENTSACPHPTRVVLVQTRAPQSLGFGYPAALSQELGPRPTYALEPGATRAVASDPDVEFDFGCFGKGKTKT